MPGRSVPSDVKLDHASQHHLGPARRVPFKHERASLQAAASGVRGVHLHPPPLRLRFRFHRGFHDKLLLLDDPEVPVWTLSGQKVFLHRSLQEERDHAEADGPVVSAYRGDRSD